MPISTALSLGFILAAVSPAIVTVGFISLKRAGYGTFHRYFLYFFRARETSREENSRPIITIKAIAAASTATFFSKKGVAKGIPSLVISAACFDDVVAISGYSIAAGHSIIAS